MKKKLFLAVGMTLVVSLFALHQDPLQLILNFVIAGVLPGLDISLGFIPSLVMIVVLLLLMKKWAKEIHFSMLRRTALEMNAEKVKDELSKATKADRRERRQLLAKRELEISS